MKNNERFFNKRDWFAFAIVMILSVIMLMLFIMFVYQTDKYGIMTSEIIPASYIEDEYEVVDAKAISIKKSTETLADGYIYVKLNDSYKDNGYHYIVWIHGHNESNVYTQFTLNDYEDWTMLPLPYNDQHLVIFEMTDKDYETSFTNDNFYYQVTSFSSFDKMFNVPVKCLCSYRVFNVGNYRECDACFTEKTVWITWDDNCEIVKLADKMMTEIRVKYEDADEETIKYAFANSIMKLMSPKYSGSDYKYDYDKLDDRSMDKIYACPVDDNTVLNHKGVCQDFAATFCVMMRSQGYRCEYIIVSVTGKENKHAINSYEYDGAKQIMDITNGLRFDLISETGMTKYNDLFGEIFVK